MKSAPQTEEDLMMQEVARFLLPTMRNAAKRAYRKTVLYYATIGKEKVKTLFFPKDDSPVEMLQAQDVTSLRAEEESRYVTTGDRTEYGARAVLIATGSTYRRLGVPGEDDLIGTGVHFCATCDGPFYKGKHVAVIGGGNSAGEGATAALMIREYLKEV